MRSVLEPPQAARAGRLHAGAGGVVRIDLADQENAVALALDRLGDDFLGPAFGVHLGGVDQRHAEIDAEAQGIGLPLRVRGAFAHVPGALAESRDLGAVRQSDGGDHSAQLLGRAQHAQEVAAPQQGQFRRAVAALQQGGGDVGALAGVAPADEAAAAVEVRRDADMRDADALDRVVHVVGEIGQRHGIRAWHRRAGSRRRR